MNILLDTNIFIYREDNAQLRADVQCLLERLHRYGPSVFHHPASISELMGDSNESRRGIVISKVQSYPPLEQPPSPVDDTDFLDQIGSTEKSNDQIDNLILYSVYKDAVDFLITEDKKLLRKGQYVGLDGRVLSILEAVAYLDKQYGEKGVSGVPALSEEYIYQLNYNDPILDSLRSEYSGFLSWWTKISRERRKAWVYHQASGGLGAILIYKLEEEPIDSIPPLPSRPRVKICTLKAVYTGSKIGELFIKMAIEYAVNNGRDEVYLTHYTADHDYLVPLIERFGFCRVAQKGTEDIFVKQLKGTRTEEEPVKFASVYYPSFVDGAEVGKYLVPIKPEFHDRLFVDHRTREKTLLDYTGEMIVEGNTIIKAYLCHAKIKGISAGDILMFYRSHDVKGITGLGVVLSVNEGIRDADEALRIVGKRTVYSKKEIEEIVKKPTKIILFQHHTYFSKTLTLTQAVQRGILKSHPQSIMMLPEKGYCELKQMGIFDGRFTVN